MPPDACLCPLCGSAIDPLPLTILPERGMIVAGDKFAILTSKEAALVSHMAEAFPRILSREALRDWLYQLDPQGGAEIKIVDVFICKVRKKLAPLGVRIDTAWGRGYALALTTKPRIISEAA